MEVRTIMGSSKQLFASGMNYILRDIQDVQEDINEHEEAIMWMSKSIQKQPLIIRKIETLKHEIIKLKSQLIRYQKELNMYKEKFSYTDEDFIKYNIHPATDAEIEQDYLNDLKELEYDKIQRKGNYTWHDHCQIIDKVNEMNMAEDIPLLSY